MAVQLSTSDRRILLHGRQGNARDVHDTGKARFLGALARYHLRKFSGFPALTFESSALFWEEDERHQRCVFQFRIAGSKNIREHFAYLGREGAEIPSGGEGENKDGEIGRQAVGFFNGDETNLEKKEVVFRTPEKARQIILRDRSRAALVEKKEKGAEAAGKPLHRSKFLDLFLDVDPDENSFRFMLSPENADGVPLMDLTRRFMMKLEHELGYRLPWVAATHYDTGHPHAHIVVRGITEFGTGLFIQPEILFKGCRIWARQIVTEYRGERSDTDIQNAYMKDAVATRYTKLDYFLQKNAAENRKQVIFSMFHARGETPAEIVKALSARLNFLQSIGLAKKVSPGIWDLDTDLQNTLRDAQIQRDIVRRISMRKIIRRSDESPSDNIVQVSDKILEKRGSIFGRIVYREAAGATGERALIYVEDRDGKIIAVPLTKKHEILMPGLQSNRFCSIAGRNRYGAIDAAIENAVVESMPDETTGIAEIDIDGDFCARHNLSDINAVKRRLRHFVEGGMCIISGESPGVTTVSFEPDAAVKIRNLPKQRRGKYTIVAEGSATADFSAMINGIGMNFLDRYLMHQTDLSGDFIWLNGEAIFLRHVTSEYDDFAQWETMLMEAVCRRIEFHQKNGRIWVHFADEVREKGRLRFAKDFSHILWAEGADFARLNYEGTENIRIGRSRVPIAGEIITGYVHLCEKTGMVFIAEDAATCVVLPAVPRLTKYEGQKINLNYPAAFARNRQTRDFWLEITPAEESPPHAMGSGEKNKEQGGRS